MQESGFIKNLGYPVHHSWKKFLEENSKSLIEIEKQVIALGSFTPEIPNVLRFLAVDIQNVKVIILGQDPYPQRGVATGRSFEVGTLKSWAEKFANVSLKNIVRAIYKAQNGEILKYSQIVSNKLNQSFQILPPSKLFSHWEEQGVLLLNTSFTCEIGKPGSHAVIWKDFSYTLISYIAEVNKNAIWFLWGDHAQKVTLNISIDSKKIISSFHPMMCYNREHDFLYSNPNCFEKTWDIIDWTGFLYQERLNSSSLF